MSKTSRIRSRIQFAHQNDTERPNREAAIGAMIRPREDGCWMFTGRCNAYGYGVVGVNGGGQEMAHRFVYQTLVDVIPDGHVLHHECENKLCVNPEHLTPMTISDHVAHHHHKASAA